MYRFSKLDGKNGNMYDIYDESTLERVGLLKMRPGTLYLFPVVEDDVVWGDPLDTWVYDDIYKSELDEAEKIVVFNESREALDEYFMGMWEDEEDDDTISC